MVKKKKGLELLKEIAKKKNSSKLVSLLDKYLIEKNRGGKSQRKTLVFHPSEISSDNTCYRRIQYNFLESLGAKFSKLSYAEINSRLARIFDNGSFLHLRYQNYFREMNILEGMWECTICGEEFYSTVTPDNCPNCSAPPIYINYKEVNVFSKQFLIFGHGDGIISLEEEGRYFIELKSINSYSFKQLREPLQHHAKQLKIYLFCSGLKYGKIIYEDKDTQNIKVFNVTLLEEDLKDIFDNITKFKYMWSRGKLMPKTCIDKTDGVTRECPYVDICFRDKIPKGGKELMLKTKL